MNVSELQNYIYSASQNGSVDNKSAYTKAAGSISGEQSNGISGENAQAVNHFSEALGEEISKITNKAENVQDKAEELRKLAGALDGSMLGTMTANASANDLAALSEDMLGSRGGREVLGKLMEGHFNSIVMSDSDDDKEDSIADDAVRPYSEAVSETQTLLDSLEKLSTGLQTENK